MRCADSHHGGAHPHTPQIRVNAIRFPDLSPTALLGKRKSSETTGKPDPVFFQLVERRPRGGSEADGRGHSAGKAYPRAQPVDKVVQLSTLRGQLEPLPY